MVPARYKMWLVMTAALLLVSGVARAQESNTTWSPFGPSDIRYDLDLFAPPDLSAYANWPRPNEGFFFQYDRLYWAISGPRRTPIGEPGTAQGFFNGPAQFDPTQQPPGTSILTPYSSTVDTGFINATQTWGNRYELGFVEDNKGWLVSIFNLQHQQQSTSLGSATNQAGLTIVFRDPQNLLLGFVDTNNDGFDDDLNVGNPLVTGIPGTFGRPKNSSGNVNVALNGSIIPTIYQGVTDFGDEVPLVPLFNTITAFNQTTIVGTEITRSWRYPTTQYGVWDMLFGIRWLLFRDVFGVTAVNDAATDTLADGSGPLVPQAMPGTSFWDSTVDNNMVGPQIGFRYSHDVARFNILAELRFMAAINFQSTHLNGELASGLPLETANPTNVPLLLQGTAFNSWKYDETFSPVGELRVGVNYQLTKAVAVQAGYNAILGGGISRASRRIDYVLPALQINNFNKNDSFFTDGINLGITFNR
jgi:Putative beta barrel porin-7 (BBP7)